MNTEKNFAIEMCDMWKKACEDYKKERDNSPDEFKRNYWNDRILHAAQRYAEWYDMIPLYN